MYTYCVSIKFDHVSSLGDHLPVTTSHENLVCTEGANMELCKLLQFLLATHPRPTYKTTSIYEIHIYRLDQMKILGYYPTDTR